MSHATVTSQALHKQKVYINIKAVSERVSFYKDEMYSWTYKTCKSMHFNLLLIPCMGVSECQYWANMLSCIILKTLNRLLINFRSNFDE